MLLFNIRNFDDFKYLFGIEIHGNGSKSRKNKILLSHLKNPQLYKYCREHDDFSLLRVRSMADLKKVCMDKLSESGKNNPNLKNKVNLLGRTFYSSQYSTDEHNGLCLDLDGSSVRYINVERNRGDLKMKSGKFFSKVMSECELSTLLNEQVRNWLTEEFSFDWETYTQFHHPEITLHVDDNFDKIYSSRWAKGNFGSCMLDKGHHYFYSDSVDAKAAYLTDKDGYLLARAIVFPDVVDQDGKHWSVCERQYSKDGSQTLMRLLVEKLIREGHITSYKQIGAGCRDITAFVDARTGESLSDRQFSIDCSISSLYQTISYQDSFIYFDMDKKKAYNYVPEGIESYKLYRLDTTDLNLDGETDDDDDPELEYSDYYDYDCESVTSAICHGQEVWVDTDRIREDFEWIAEKSEWISREDLVQCDACGKWVLRDEAIWEKGDDSVFCSEEHHQEYVEERFYFAQFEEKYYPHVTDIITVSQWDSLTQSYHRLTIGVETLESLKREGQAFGFGESWFIMAPSLDAEAA